MLKTKKKDAKRAKRLRRRSAKHRKIVCPTSWQQQLVDLLAQGPAAFERAIELRNSKAPTSLWKFYAPLEHNFNSVENCYHWASNASEFADRHDTTCVGDFTTTFKDVRAFDAWQKRNPRMAQTLRNGGVTHEDISQLIYDSATAIPRLAIKYNTSFAQVERTAKELINYTSEFNKTTQKNLISELKLTKICCFTDTPNEAMWERVQGSRGFLVEHDFQPAFIRTFLFPVLYQNQKFDITKIWADTVIKGSFIPTPYIVGMHKLSDFAWESEWRLIFAGGLTEFQFVNAPKFKFFELGVQIPCPKPLRIIAGTRMSVSDLARLQKIAAKHGIPFSQQI